MGGEGGGDINNSGYKCKCSLHNASRSPNIPHFAGTNLVALHIRNGPRFSHHKAKVLAVGPREFFLGVKSVKMTF